VQPTFDHVEEGLEAGRLRPEAQTPQQRGTERERPADAGDLVPPESDQSVRAVVVRRRVVWRRQSAPPPTTSVQTLAQATASGTERSRATSSVDTCSRVAGQPERTRSQGVTQASTATGSADAPSPSPCPSEPTDAPRRSTRCTSAVAKRKLGPTSSAVISTLER
jgi:hypothetical protein